MKYLYHPVEGAKLFEDDENPEGWFDTPASFGVISAPSIDHIKHDESYLTDEVPDERAELLRLADEIGVTVDKRWGIARLREAVRGDRP